MQLSCERCHPGALQVSYNIGHLAYLNAKRYNLQRVFFGGFYIRGHPYTMETISYAIRFWSKVHHCCASLSLPPCHADQASPNSLPVIWPACV